VTGTETARPVSARPIADVVHQRPFGIIRHSLALARRGWIRIRRTPEGLADAIVAPVFFLLMFYYLFGGAVFASRHVYLQRIFPATVVMTVVFAGMMATGFNINADLRKGIYDRFRSLPIGRSAPLIGAVLSDMVRYLIALAVLFGTGFLLGFRVQTRASAALAACGVAIGFAFCGSWAYVWLGVIIREPSGLQGISFSTLFPLVFGTNMLVPTQTVPGWLQAWIHVNPVTHVMDACRGLLVGGPVARPFIESLLWSAGLLVVFAPLAVLAYRHRGTT
jgi:oleandomycin transport system permease protein